MFRLVIKLTSCYNYMYRTVIHTTDLRNTSFRLKYLNLFVARMMTRPEVDEAEAKTMRPRPTLTRSRPRPELHYFLSQILHFDPSFSPKPKFSVDVRRDLKKFRLKTGFHMGT